MKVHPEKRFHRLLKLESKLRILLLPELLLAKLVEHVIDVYLQYGN